MFLTTYFLPTRLLYAGRKVEGAIGVESMAIFLNVINLACGMLTSTALFSFYVLLRFEVFLFMATFGFGGMAAALAVALKLLRPKEPPIPSVPAIQHQHLPLLLCLFSLISWALGVTAASQDMPFVVTGTFCSWWYLRFVQRHPETGQTGDVSDEFAFVTLFPPGLRRYLAPLADFSYGVCVLLGYFKERKRMMLLPSAISKNNTLGEAHSGDPHSAMLLLSPTPPVEVDPVSKTLPAQCR